jgi:uncharacterized protein (TIGR01777 family)
MRITLTGATGFIGARLVQRWLQDKHELHSLGRSAGKLPQAVRFWKWAEPERTAPPLESLEGSDAVVHLAGEPVAQRWTQEAKERIRASRIDVTGNLVKAISQLHRKPSVLISGSAVGYYGSRGDEVLTEESAPGRGFLPDLCVEWERRAQQAAASGLRVVCLRTGIVLGVEGGALTKMLTPFRLGIGGPLGTGEQWMPWIHADDMVGLIDFALKTESVQGPLNGCAPNPVTNRDFSSQLGSALHRPAVVPTPEFAIKLLFGEMAEVILASDRMLPKAALAAGYGFHFPELCAALNQLLR